MDYNESVSTLAELKEIDQKEKKAIVEADIIVVLLSGSHIELGIAIGNSNKIYLYSSNREVDNFATTTTFYHSPGIEKCF